MGNIIILEDEQLEEIVSKAVNRCLDERDTDTCVNNQDEDGYYSRSELCKLLHIANSTLWRIECKGLLKSQKVGRKNLYCKKEIYGLIKSGKLAKYNK